MDGNVKILVINPGSTSTKIALFQEERQLFSVNLDLTGIDYNSEDGYGTLKKLRQKVVDAVTAQGFTMEEITAYAGRGGKMVPCRAGVYSLNDKLLEASDISKGRCHALRYGPHLVAGLANEFGGQAFVMNTQTADELDLRARFTGYPGVWRKSGLHVLNHKEVAARVAEQLGKPYGQSNLIVGHLGGGISIAAHKKGMIVDFSGGNGEGPIAPNRSGTIPAGEMIEMAFSGKYTKQELESMAKVRGGMLAHLGTSDARLTEQKIQAGDAYAKNLYDAMIYQISKHIGAMAVTLEGNVDAIVLTGGMANSKYLTAAVETQVGWIAPVILVPGEYEMEGLCCGILRVLKGKEEILTYTGDPVFNQKEMEALRAISIENI